MCYFCFYYLVVVFGMKTRRVRDYGSIRRGNIEKDSKFLFLLLWRSMLSSDGKLALVYSWVGVMLSSHDSSLDFLFIVLS